MEIIDNLSNIFWEILVRKLRPYLRKGWACVEKVRTVIYTITWKIFISEGKLQIDIQDMHMHTKTTSV